MDIANLSKAITDFNRARGRAKMQELLAHLTGDSADLLSYDEVRRKLHLGSKVTRGVQQIPLDAIVGSVGRYKDFTRTFLPRNDGDQARWAAVKVAQMSPEGLPPIEVYQISDVYFVLDGNHRVSIARQLGSRTIEAHVIEVQSNIPLAPDIQPNDLILKAEYADFLAETNLTNLRPQADLTLTSAGKYPLILEYIEVHQYFMGLEQEREISYEEAITHWFDAVYLPTVACIHETNLLVAFPQRTEADFYVWLTDHRAELQKVMGWDVPLTTAVASLPQPSPIPQRLIRNLLHTVRGRAG
jgi:hypothetical protein